MKKIYKLLLTIILCFCFSSTVAALDYSAEYSNEKYRKDGEPLITFFVKGSYDEINISPGVDFSYKGETQTTTSSWGIKRLEVISIRSNKKSYIKSYDKLKDYKDKKYLYYDIKVGNNEFYLSDDDFEGTNALDYDVKLELVQTSGGSSTGGTSGGNSKEELVAKFVMNCGDINKLNTQAYIDTNISNSINIYKVNNKYVLKIDGTIFPTDKKIDSMSENRGYIYDTLDSFKQKVCGHLQTYNEDMFVFDYLIEDLKSISDNKRNLVAVTINKPDTYPNNEYFPQDIIIVSSEKIDSNWKTVELEGVKYTYNSMTVIPYISDEDDINDEKFTCYYKYNGSSPDSAIITYNKTKDKFELDASYRNYYKPDPDFIDGLIMDNIKNGICPNEIRLCNNQLPGEMYFSNACIGNNFLIYEKTDSEGNLVLPEVIPFPSDRYKELLGDLASPLGDSKPEALSYNLVLDKKTITLNDIPARDGICKKGECTNPREQTITGLKNIKEYCVEIERMDKSLYNNDDLQNREEECVAFDKFYDKLVDNGIVADLVEGCGFISDDLNDKLVLILDIIKIAGPVLAILFGMWDFTKVLFTGDADKEMKTAGKRFITRIIAAALLFLIPALIKIPLNVAFEDKIDTSNPFCDVED